MKGGFIRVFAIAVVFLLLFLPAKKEVSLDRAHAASLNAYPTVCLGGWQNPNNAASEPDGNVATLSGQTAAQIFCGYFKSDDQSESPTSVVLNFSWNVNVNAPAVPAPTDIDSQNWNAALNGAANASTTDTSPPGDNISSSTSSPSSSDEEGPAPATTTSLEATAMVATSTDTVSTGTTSTDTVSSSPADASATEDIAPNSTVQSSTPMDAAPPPPPTATTTTDETATTTSFWNGIGKLVAGLFIGRAEAQIPTAPNFLEVSHSLDGTNWQVLGDVNQNNWNGLTFAVPVGSWDDINNLQIQIAPLPTTEMPAVSLDGMWLQVEYNHSLMGILNDGANAALDAAANLTDAVQNALANAADTVTNALTRSEEIQIPAAPAAPIPLPHRYQLALGAVRTIQGGLMPWASTRDSQKNTPPLPATPLPEVAMAGTSTIQIQGACSDAYYTLLVFAHADDYLNDPTNAVLNRAYPCTGGSFSTTISDKDLPTALESDIKKIGKSLK